MTFFDKKEEVMKIELTPHGKYLLSIGKLKPYSYRFFDENVIYDSSAMGFTEEQNNTHKRITEETPSLKMNPNITGVETNIKKFTTPSVSIKHLKHPTEDDNLSTNNEALGTCSYETKNNSALALDMFGAHLIEKDIKNYYSSPNVSSVPIPQIPINMHISSSVYEDVFAEIEDDQEGVLAQNDGSGFVLNYKNPIIRFREFNGFDEKDNFNMTAYKVVSGSLGITYYKLKIPKRTSPIVGNLLVGEKDLEEMDFELDDNSGGSSYDSDDLYFYVNIVFDRDISDEEICERVKDYEIENIFLDDDIICPDAVEEANLDIYGTFVKDYEDCD